MTTYININGDVRDAASLTLPQDRTFRSAWQFNGAAVEIDMVAARGIHRDNLRVQSKNSVVVHPAISISVNVDAVRPRLVWFKSSAEALIRTATPPVP